MKCIQCQSEECGPARCRFSMMPHSEYRTIKETINSYACAMTERDKQPKWERELRQGARDIRNGE